jgi:predicted RNA-binding protein with PIN domain
MLFLIDGYNVTRSDPATRALSLEGQRDALARRLAARAGTLLGPGRVVIVFDGVDGAGLAERVGQIEVRYSRGGQTADDAIVHAARGTAEAIVLVTSDNGLADRVRAHLGATVTVRPREVCFEDARPSAGRRPAGRVARDEGLPKGANRITEELKGIWLDGDTDSGDTD